MAAEPAQACPDPSVHKHQHKLSEQASTAALYVTRPTSSSNNDGSVKDENVLGPDGKLSSKSAATSLKHAKPQDLPSFPSHGYTADSAGKAAMLAKDYKMKELWQPEQSMAGSKAAVLAAGKGGKVDLWEAQATAAGQSAASLAFKNKGLSPQAYSGNTPENKSKALQAATMSANASRARAGSTPAPAPALYPDAHNAVPNALNAAAVSHRNSVKVKPDHSGGWNDEANQAARIKNSHMDPKLFTEHPDIQTDEDRRQAALRASAISMAKSMYESQNRDAMLADPDGPGAHHEGARAAARNQAATHPDVKQEALAYISLQDTAHKLAAERLAKIDKDMEASRFREHYGYEDKPKRLSSRLSMRSVGAGGRRARATSESAANVSDSDDDEAAARRIRQRTANLGSASKEIDEKRQREDRARLLAAAEKRVSSRMHDMDQQVYRDTGKVSESMMAEWEEKARVRAQQDREKRADNPGRTHIGGGKYMETADIEAIAAARLKGTLDEINATAEQRRARDAELAAQKDEQERLRMEQKIQDQAQKEEWRRIRNEDKAAAKKEKDEEKARKAEEKRKEEKRKSRDEKRDTAAAVAGGAAPGEVANKVKDDDEPVEDSTATDGREKHASAFSRLKDHFRKSGAPKEDKAEQEAPKEQETHTATGGAVAGAATGATLADIGHSGDQDLDAQQASHVIVEDEGRPTTATTATTAESEVAPVAEPVSPLTEEEKHLEPAAPITAPAQPDEVHDHSLGHDATIAGTAGAAVGAGFLGAHEISEHKGAGSQASSISGNVIADEGLEDDYEPPAEDPSRPKFEQQPSFTLNRDQAPTTSLTAGTRPDLERHISRIPESDSDSDEDSDDWNDEHIEKPTSAAAAPTAAVVSETQPATGAEPPHPADEVYDETMMRMEDQRAEPPTDLPESLQPPGVPTNVPTDAISTMAIKSVHNSPVTGVADTSTGDDKERDKDHHHNKLQKKSAKGKEAALASVSTAGTASDVKISEEGTRELAAAPSSPSKVTKTEPKHDHRDEKDEKKGFRGLFSRIRNKSKSEKQPGSFMTTTNSNESGSVPYDSTKAGKKPTPVATASDAAKSENVASTIPPVDTGSKFEVPTHTGTDGAIGDSTRISGLAGNPEPESPSSFNRHEADLADPDDVSSSGADEDDVQRGRGGRIAKKLGFGKSRTTKPKDKALEPTAATATATATATDMERGNSNTTEENEQFEEARDHFDESLAPPPAFGGQKKSESPVRETKFKEDV